jgi:hypothetical protein
MKNGYRIIIVILVTLSSCKQSKAQSSKETFDYVVFMLTKQYESNTSSARETFNIDSYDYNSRKIVLVKTTYYKKSLTREREQMFYTLDLNYCYVNQEDSTSYEAPSDWSFYIFLDTKIKMKYTQIIKNVDGSEEKFQDFTNNLPSIIYSNKEDGVKMRKALESICKS